MAEHVSVLDRFMAAAAAKEWEPPMTELLALGLGTTALNRVCYAAPRTNGEPFPKAKVGALVVAGQLLPELVVLCTQSAGPLQFALVDVLYHVGSREDGPKLAARDVQRLVGLLREAEATVRLHVARVLSIPEIAAHIGLLPECFGRWMDNRFGEKGHEGHVWAQAALAVYTVMGEAGLAPLLAAFDVGNLSMKMYSLEGLQTIFGRLSEDVDAAQPRSLRPLRAEALGALPQICQAIGSLIGAARWLGLQWREQHPPDLPSIIGHQMRP